MRVLVQPSPEVGSRLQDRSPSTLRRRAYRISRPGALRPGPCRVSQWLDAGLLAQAADNPPFAYPESRFRSPGLRTAFPVSPKWSKWTRPCSPLAHEAYAISQQQEIAPALSSRQSEQCTDSCRSDSYPGSLMGGRLFRLAIYAAFVSAPVAWCLMGCGLFRGRLDAGRTATKMGDQKTVLALTRRRSRSGVIRRPGFSVSDPR